MVLRLFDVPGKTMPVPRLGIFPRRFLLFPELLVVIASTVVPAPTDAVFNVFHIQARTVVQCFQ